MTDSEGAFNETLSLSQDIALGDHTLTLSGVLADGSLSKTSIGAIVVDVDDASVAPTDNGDNESAQGAAGKGGVPFNPQSEPKSVVSLLGDVAGLMALAGIAAAGSSSGRRREEGQVGRRH